ncbi:hypothetical protein Y032_0716g1786 [Ancylostoma ceylanicum]|uniref:Uncharacterized protein n=1 Tax=Ancylostoma ceylanicum TaxID=53326 RepID=A0A016WF43_9BILA|nr:hypothetical protein Y032_0716g1786 [Ancylostoma ceylanicum]
MSRLHILLAFLVLTAQGSDVDFDQESEHGHGHGAVRIPVVAAAAPILTGVGVGAGAPGTRRQRSPTSEEGLTKSKECYLYQLRQEWLFVCFVDYSQTAPSCPTWHSSIKVSYPTFSQFSVGVVHDCKLYQT